MIQHSVRYTQASYRSYLIRHILVVRRFGLKLLMLLSSIWVEWIENALISLIMANKVCLAHYFKCKAKYAAWL